MKINRFSRIAFIVLSVALVSCSANLELRRQQEEANRNLGEEYYKKGDYTSALREFLKAEKLYSKDPYLHYGLGLTYKAKKKPDLAVKHFEKAIEMKPDYASAKNALGTVYLDKKEWDTAIQYFEEVSGNILYATPHLPLSNIGWAYYNKKEYPLAEKFYRDALKVEPKFINALQGLGLVYIAMGKISEAVVTLERAVKYYPRYAPLYFYLGKTYTLSHDYKKALNAYNKILTLVPDTALAREAEKEANLIKNIW
jgi:tetratricopeptide (TPR) repeat protein